MNRHLILIVGYLFMYQTVSAQTPSNDLNWQLKWEDNFHTLNTNIWEAYDHFDHWGNPYSISPDFRTKKIIKLYSFICQ